MSSSGVAYSDALSNNPPHGACTSSSGARSIRACELPADVGAGPTRRYNLTYYKNPKVDSLIGQALAAEATSVDDVGEALLSRRRRSHAAGYPYIWVAYPHYRVATAKNITWSGYDPLFAYTVDFYNVQMN